MLEVRRARIVLGAVGESRPAESEQALVVGERVVGTFFYEGGRQAAVARSRLLPALASLLAVAIEHDHLAEEAYQAEALRRSDVVKTAIIRAVSPRPAHAARDDGDGARKPARQQLRALSGPTATSCSTRSAPSTPGSKRLVENLLDLSRLQAGAAQPLPAVWAADQLLVDALDELGAAGRVEIVVPEQVPLVRVDAAQIERVIVNLLENALKFSPPAATVRVRVDATREEVVMRVINQGRGIPQAELTRIFEPFQRAARQNAAAAPGSGSRSRRGFAEANGGRIWVGVDSRARAPPSSLRCPRPPKHRPSLRT